nr:unnamed protein product [Digitaria exilis]
MKTISNSTASLEFKLDFSGTKNIPVGEAVYSNNFSAGGHVWRIACYPRGIRKAFQDYLSIYLELTSKSRHAVKAICDLFVMETDGSPSSSHADRFVQSYQNKPDGGRRGRYKWGNRQLAKRGDLESPRHVAADGRVTIMCVVIVVVRDGHGDPLAVPPSDIGAHLGRLLDYCAAEDDTSDVSFVVGGETFAAHRAVLAARSPVLKAQLFGPMADAKMPSITLHEIAPVTFKAMLRFVYTDSLPCADGGLVEDLLAVADRYALDRLKLWCARKIWDNVSVDTVAATLDCAETYNCPELKMKCVAFLVVNFKKAVLTDGFVRLAQKFPSILAELREKV